LIEVPEAKSLSAPTRDSPGCRVPRDQVRDFSTVFCAEGNYGHALDVEIKRVAVEKGTPATNAVGAHHRLLDDLVANKKAAIIRVYLPPDANTLLTVTDHCLRSRHYVNVIVAGKQPSQWLDMESAVKHCPAGLSIWKWASNDGQGGSRLRICFSAIS